MDPSSVSRALSAVVNPRMIVAGRPAATKLAQTHGAQTTDAAHVFDDTAVRAVAIGSSTDTHADLIMRAAKAGKAIFCEKPVDLDLQRARTCADAVRAAGVTCLIGFQRRYDPTFASVKARIARGDIGRPEMLIVTSRDPGAPPVEHQAFRRHTRTC
jgi:myo-inositol 2-dehydrogenase/D-chiro-inositol 1-dehydrogenase